MGATAVTGTGEGGSGKLTTKELAILANGPNIILAGRVELAEDFFVNPPSPTATVVLSPPLAGGFDDYIIMTTGLNTGSIYVAATEDDDDGNFSEFRVIAEEDGTCMYVIVKRGIKPNI